MTHAVVVQPPKKPRAPPETGREVFFAANKGKMIGTKSETEARLLKLWDNLSEEEQGSWSEKAKVAQKAYQVRTPCGHI